MSEPDAQPPSDVQARLAPLRKRIDELDQQLVTLLNERAKVVVEVGKVKADDNSPVYAPEREHRVLEQLSRHNQGPLSDTTLKAIWRELMSGSFALERPPSIGYLGPPGSFSHLAARAKFGASVEYRDLEDIMAVFEEIARGHIDLGLVPIENSYIGGIGETLDCFLEYHHVRVCAEVQIAVHHNLLAHCPVEQVKKIYSKPEVLSQCRKWLMDQAHRPERIAVESSSRAAELASTEQGAAAVASTLAGELYELPIQVANIEDNPNNITRFFVIAHQTPPATGDDKTAVMFTTAHKPGALASVLNAFNEAGVNLTHIDKRPSRRVNWEYYFFVDCVGHESEPELRQAIESARQHCLQLTVLGSFPHARELL